MDRLAVQVPGHTDRVMVDAIAVQDSWVIKADMVIKVIRATKVEAINRGINNSSSRVIRVIRSS